MENNRLRIVMAALLLAVVFFYNAQGVAPEVPKLEKPQEDIVKMVEELAAIDNEEDSSKVAGMFNAVSEKLKDSKIEKTLVELVKWKVFYIRHCFNQLINSVCLFQLIRSYVQLERVHFKSMFNICYQVYPLNLCKM